MPFLYLVHSDNSIMGGWKLLDGAPLTIGRSEVLAHAPDEYLSREHFRISSESRGFVIRDLGSRNGTWVNGERIRCAALVPGVRIRAGNSTFIFEPGLQTVLSAMVEKEHVTPGRLSFAYALGGGEK